MLFDRVGAIILKDNKILLVTGNNSKFYWTPGGKTLENETNEEALQRELKEELNIKASSIKFYYSYKGENRATKKKGNFGYYLIKKYIGKISPDNEIKEARFLNKYEIKNGKIKTSPGVKILVNLLEKDGFL